VEETNRNYYSNRISDLNTIAQDIFNRETKQYNDVYSKASKLENGDEKDIVIRNIVKEHSEVQKKYDEINRLILSSSTLDLKVLAEKVDKIEKEINNLEDESEQINEF
jgi:seryl-tRNA synthetase